MATAQVQFYKSAIRFGGNYFPCYPGAQLTAPLNYAVPPIIGNYWQLNYGVGLVQPYVEVSLAVLDHATLCPLLQTFLNNWLTRVADAGHDTNLLGGTGVLDFWDGYRGWSMLGTKADSFTIGTSKGDDIRFTARFCGTQLQLLSADPGFGGWDTSALLRFPSLKFLNQSNGDFSAYDQKIWRLDLSFSNNHNPDLSLDGTMFPVACNAGMQTAGFQIMVQAKDQVNIPGGDPNLQAGTQLGTADGLAFGFRIAGAAKRADFKLNRIINATPAERPITPPRIMRQYAFLCLGSDAQTNPPLVVSSNF